MIVKRCLLILSLGLVLSIASGCAVPQPRGQGQYKLVMEPATRTWYHLYLPVDYVRGQGQHPDMTVKRWPLVMTFHGMKPYDNALPQEREWEQQADIYGYIVCAPQLETSDSFMEYPLTKEHSYVLRDKRNVIAVMDHVFATTLADPKRVLSTSWSCGGYLAHYFPNRFPDKFSCIATRLSNFSPQLLLEENVPRYKDMPVAIFIGDGDFPACKSESEEAVAWYSARRFRVVRGKMIDRMGHQRIPQTAAAFFAEQLDIKPLRPVEAAQTLAWVQMTDYQPSPQLIARLTPPATLLAAARDTSRTGRQTGSSASPSSPAVAPSSKSRSGNYVAQNSGRSYPAGQTPAYDPTPEPRVTAKPPAEPAVTPVAKKDAASPSVPVSGAGATRVAQATPRQTNWLEPPSTPAAAPKDKPAEKPSTPVTPDRPPPKAESAKPADSAKAAPKAKPAAEPAPTPPPAVRPPARDFSPKDAGPRHYDVAAPQRDTSVPVLASSAGGSASGGAAARPKASPHAPKAEQPSKSKSVVVKLSGPNIGRAPHWIGYSVDLPSGTTQGADFLWMDNGVWIGDEARGVKILETPGRHEITVLMVGKNNEEYRGSAVVEVLDPYPSGRGSN